MSKSFIPIFIIFTLTSLAGCEETTTRQKLLYANSIISTSPDSALAILKAIQYNNIKSNSDLIFYQLLYNQAHGELGKWLSISEMNNCVDYYSKHTNNHLLQRCYYYRGLAYSKAKNDMKHALADLKTAESLFKYTNDTLLQFNIYRAIIDCEIQNYNFSLIEKYIKRESECAKSLKNDNVKSKYFCDMIYYMFTKNDHNGCLHYIKKAIKSAQNSKDKTKGDTFATIAKIYSYYINKPDSAIKYSQLALSYKDDFSTNLFLAYALINKCEVDQAQAIVDKYKNLDDPSKLCLIMFLQSKILYVQGKYKEAYKLIEEAERKSDEDEEYNVAIECGDIQEKYDNQLLKLQHEQKNVKMLSIFSVTVTMLLITLIIAGCIIKKKVDSIREMESEIEDLNLRIEKIRFNTSQTIQQKCDTLNLLVEQKLSIIKKYETINARIKSKFIEKDKTLSSITRGLQYMYYIMQNEPNLQINKSERIDFINCYQILDPGFVQSIQYACNESMTVQEQLLCILFKMGKSSTQIKSTLSMSDDAYRKAKSRIRTKLRNDSIFKTFCENMP